MSDRPRVQDMIGDLSTLREGVCPTHGTMLERRDDYGWCDECKSGWSMADDTVSIHLVFGEGTISGADGKETPIRSAVLKAPYR